MKTHAHAITARVTLASVLVLSAIALVCATPFAGSYAASSKGKMRSPVREQRFADTSATLPTQSSGAISAPVTCTSPTTVVTNSNSAATDMQANHHIVSTSVCTTSAAPDLAFFTVKVQSLAAPLTPNSFYFTTFTIDGVPPAAGSVFGVKMTMDATGTVPTFQSYLAGASNSGAVDGRFATASVPAETGSNFTPDGTITIIVKLSHIGVPVGTHTLTNWDGAVALTAGGVVTSLVDGMPSTTGTPPNIAPTRGGIPFTVTLNSVAPPIVPAPQDTGPKIGFENFEPPGVLVSGTALSSGFTTVEYLGRGAGEPSVGANWVTGVVNFQSDLETEFVTFDDSCNLSNPKATWVNRRAPTSNFIDSDPIGFTDHTSSTANRVFAAELTLLSPDTVKISHSDDDGVTWVPDQSGGLGSAVDHETIGGGPYHSPLPSPGPIYPHAVYYCSQDVAAALCSRSDDGGSTYGPSVAIYPVSSCTGLHGHVKVAPDGTVYVPNRACGNVPLLNGGNAAVVVSTDNGVTWTVRPVQNSTDLSTGATDDPAVGIDAGGRIYCLFAQSGTNAAVGISIDQGQTWTNIFDVGAGLGLTNVAFPAAVGGDAGRAAVAFYASKAGSGGSSADGYRGVWHLYVSETFDGGNHWTTADVTPQLPIQRMGLLRGGGGAMDRNLLDFFDITIDKDGRVVVGYVNGCSGGDCSQAPVNADGSTTVTGNTYSATAAIARQSSGRRMFVAKDPASSTSVPGMPSITQRRVGPIVRLAWNEADPGNNGGVPPDQTITNYQILRGTAPGGEGATPIATVAGNVNKFDDTTATDRSVTYYYQVVAVNSIGSSCANNETAAPFVGDTCSGMIIHRNLPNHPEAVGGSTGVPVGPTPTPTPTPTPPALTPQLLIDYIAVSEPPATNQLMFQMKVSNLSSVPANSRWRIVWNSVASPVEQYFVGMTTDQNSTATFEYGTLETVVEPPVVGVIGIPTEHPAGAPDSGSFNADGTITILIDKSKVGSPHPGDILGALNGRTLNTGDTPPETTERSSQLIDHTFVKGNTDNSFPPATYTVVGNVTCSAGSIVPVSAISRKTHGSVGTFDVDLPLIGQPGIEDRFGGASGNHTVVITFSVPVTVTSANMTPGAGGTGSVSSFSVNNTQVTVNLTNVSNAQTLSINLVGVSGGGNSGNVSVPMAVLTGDTNADRFCDAVDVSQTKSQSGKAVNLSNFREDVNVDGFIDAVDTALVKSKSGTALP